MSCYSITDIRNCEDADIWEDQAVGKDILVDADYIYMTRDEARRFAQEILEVVNGNTLQVDGCT